MKLHTKRFATGLAAFSALALAPLSAGANTTVYHFGNLVSGEGAPQQLDFATLTVTQSGADLNFTLDASGLDGFDAQSFLSTLAIDGDKVGRVKDVSGGTSVKMAKGGGPNGSYEFRFDLAGKKKDRLTDDETVSWTWVGGAGHLNGIGAEVQGLGNDNGPGAWYQTLAVPEPGAYAMFLSGLAVLGIAARRRRHLKG